MADEVAKQLMLKKLGFLSAQLVRFDLKRFYKSFKVPPLQSGSEREINTERDREKERERDRERDKQEREIFSMPNQFHL